MISKILRFSLDNTKFNSRLSYLINACWVLVLILSVIIYIVRNCFVIDKIMIAGSINHVTPDQLTYIAKNRLKGTLFTLDIDGLKNEFIKLPWVKEVNVERKFPNAITVFISEYTAVARIGDFSLISPDGKIFDGTSIDLPIFNVDYQLVPHAIKVFEQINNILKSHNTKISQIAIDSSRVINITAMNQLKITICENNLENELLNLNKYWTNLYTINPNLNSINLCYPNAVAINDPINNKSDNLINKVKMLNKQSTTSQKGKIK